MERLQIYMSHIRFYGTILNFYKDDIRYSLTADFIAEGDTISIRTDNAGSIIAFEYKILKILGISVAENVIIVEAELIKDYEIPDEWFCVNEYTSHHVFHQVAWFHTEKEALEKFKEIKFGSVTRSNKWSPAAYHVEVREWKD